MASIPSVEIHKRAKQITRYLAALTVSDASAVLDWAKYNILQHCAVVDTELIEGVKYPLPLNDGDDSNPPNGPGTPP